MPEADLSVLTADDLLYPAMAQADDLPDVAVTEAPGVGFADRSVTGLPGRLVAGDGTGELSLVIGHGKECIENLTEKGRTYSFLYMETDQITLARRPLGGYLVKADGRVIGWVVKRRNRWQAYAAKCDHGHPLGSFATRREAVDEVWIWREEWVR